MDSRIGTLDASRIALVFVALVSATTPGAAQLAGSAGIGASVPASIGPFEIHAGATMNRIGSSIAPRTTLDVESRIGVALGSGGGWFGASALQAREIDSLVVRPLLAAGIWRTFRDLTIHLETASHVARLGGRPPIVTRTRAVDLANGDELTFIDTVPGSGIPSHNRWRSDLEAGASWTTGRYRFSAIMGSRPALEIFPRAVWGRVGSAVQLTSSVALVTAVGAQPAQIALGVPASRFASVAFGVAPRRRTTGHDIAPPVAVTPFSIRVADAGHYVVAYRVTNAHRVEISGDFAKWNRIALEERGAGLWVTTVAIAPGTYHMSVRIDGGPWTAPPGTTEVSDDFDGTAGIVVVR